MLISSSRDEGVIPDPAQSLCKACETLQRTEGHPGCFRITHAGGLGENKGKRSLANETQTATLRNQ